MEPGPDRARLLAHRERAFRRVPSRRVRSERAAAAFVDEVGLCSTFYRFPDGLACLWEAVAGRRDPRWPRHSHHDPGIALTWRLKDVLPARRLIYYGKLLRGRPILMALDVFAAWYALVRGRQLARDYRAEHAAGRLSERARRLMDVLVRRHPLYTRDWRAESFLLEPGATRGFEQAVAELQTGLWVVKTEERYEPSFSYRWDLVEAWLPDAVREGRRLSRGAAVRRLLDRYLQAAAWGSDAGLARLFALPRVEVRQALDALARTGAVRSALRVNGLPGEVVVHRAVLSSGAPR